MEEKWRFIKRTIEHVNQFREKGNICHYLSDLVSSNKIIEFNVLKMSAGSFTHFAVWGFELLRALPNISFLLWFCWFESVYSSLSPAPASSPTALTCSHQLWFLNTKERKENSVHNLFILGMSQLPSQCASDQRVVLRTEPKALLILTCLFPQAYWFSNKVLLSVWSLGEVPAICILSWTRTSAVLICVLFPVAQQKALGTFWQCLVFTDVFANHFHAFFFSVAAQGLSVTGRKM